MPRPIRFCDNDDSWIKTYVSGGHRSERRAANLPLTGTRLVPKFAEQQFTFGQGRLSIGTTRKRNSETDQQQLTFLHVHHFANSSRLGLVFAFGKQNTLQGS